MDMSDPFDAEMVTAFSELFNNIVKHSYRGSGDGVIHISIEQDEHSIRISTVDAGTPFDFDTVKIPVIQDLPETGLGIYIVRACVDELEYRPGPPNEWTLSKHYRSSPSDELTQPDSPKGAAS